MIDMKKAMPKDFDLENTVMVGDQLYTDIIFGNAKGMATVKVKPVSLFEESFREQMIRAFEDGLIKKTLGKERRKHPELDFDL